MGLGSNLLYLKYMIYRCFILYRMLGFRLICKYPPERVPLNTNLLMTVINASPV
jgi:hypothetical protein